MPERSAAEQSFLDQKLDVALTEAGLPLDSPIRGILNRDAQVIDGVGLQGQKAFGVKICRDGMQDVNLRERLRELKGDAMYRHAFPKETTVAVPAANA